MYDQCFFKVRLEEPLNNFERPQIFCLHLLLKLRSTTVSINIIVRKLEFIIKTFQFQMHLMEPIPLGHHHHQFHHHLPNRGGVLADVLGLEDRV